MLGNAEGYALTKHKKYGVMVDIQNKYFAGHYTLVPMVWDTMGNMNEEGRAFLKKLVAKIAARTTAPYSVVMMSVYRQLSMVLTRGLARIVQSGAAAGDEAVRTAAGLYAQSARRGRAPTADSSSDRTGPSTTAAVTSARATGSEVEGDADECHSLQETQLPASRTRGAGHFVGNLQHRLGGRSDGGEPTDH